MLLQKQLSFRHPFALSSLSPILSPTTAASHQASESEMPVPHEKRCPCQADECYEWAAFYGSPWSDICSHQPKRLFFPPERIDGFQVKPTRQFSCQLSLQLCSHLQTSDMIPHTGAFKVSPGINWD